jgi:hypothetical protein
LSQLGAQAVLLVSNEDLEAADDLGERNAGVALPVLDSLGAVDEDNEVLSLALVVDLVLHSIAASHFEWVCVWIEVSVKVCECY